MAGPVRKSAVAGSWYPGTPARIAAEVESYLEAARPKAPAGRLIGLISPHAGLMYSGPVAAYGYGLLRGRSGLTVILVGPCHRYAFEGVAVCAKGAFETPLGPIPIDEAAAGALLGPGILDAPRPHQEEHSLEMQLPFLQHLVQDLHIVPCLMGSQSREEVDGLAAALPRAVAAAGRTALLVASSDLSHYHPAAVANRMDAQVVGDVEGFDPESLMQRLERTHEHACGGGPIVAVMRAAKALGADHATVLRYADSGDAGDHDKSRVVGYLSAALTAGAS